MKIFLYAICLSTLIFSCNEDVAEKSAVKKNADNKQLQRKNDIIKDVAPEKLATLFFKYVPQKQAVVETKKEIVARKIDGSRYRVVIDWMVANKRYVKLKDLTTGREHVVIEGDNSSNIRIVERTLFTYKFRIDGQIVEVKR